MDGIDSQSSMVTFYSLLFWIVCGVIVSVFVYKLITSIFNKQAMSFAEGIIIFVGNVGIFFILLHYFKVNIAIGVTTFFIIVSYISTVIIVNRRGKLALKEQIELDIKRCIEAIEKDPKNMTAYEKLGDIHRSLKNFDKALTCYNKVAELTKNNNPNTMISKKIKSTEVDKDYYSGKLKKKK